MISSDHIEQKVCFEKMVTQETVSTTDDDSRHDSDGLSETTQEGNELRSTDEHELTSDLEDADDELSGLRTPDPLDLMPWVKVAPAFSETQIADAMARLENVAREQVFAGAGAPRGMQMLAMPPTGAGANFPFGTVMVPVPVAMPKMIPMPQFSFPVAAPVAPQVAVPEQVPVPAGFKLVRIPDFDATKAASSPAAEATEPKDKSGYSEIADPSKTDRKIFVGGLSPVTTEESLLEYFSKYGPVADAKVIREGEKSKGFAFVQFVDTTPSKVLDTVHFIDQRRCGVGLAFQRQR
jgi:hypothetical protein